MKSGTIHILDLDFEYKYWKNKLYFYLSEIEILEGRLQVLYCENASFSLSPEEQALITIQKDSVKNMLNHIGVLEDEMALYAEDYPIDINHSHYSSHIRTRLDMTKIMSHQDSIIDSLLPILSHQ
jgi:hypothetical protein